MSIKSSSDQKVVNGQIRYVDESFPDGWRLVSMNIGEKHIIEGTKVKMIEERNGRVYFTIMEGIYKGKRASLCSISYLTTKNKQILIPAKLIYSMDKKSYMLMD